MIRLSLMFSTVLALAAGCASSRLPVASAVRVAPEPSPAARQEGRPSRREMVRRILPHNARLVVFEKDDARHMASGVAIGSGTGPSGAFTYFITNAHAVDTQGLTAPRLAILVDSGGETAQYAAETVAVGSVPEMDLALLKVRGVSLPPARLAEDAELELGDDVVVASAPFGRHISFSGGMISQVEWHAASHQPWMLKTDAPVGYGASGGGIYSLSSGKLLAIVEGYRTAQVDFAVADQPFSLDVPMPGETFAAPSAKVRSFLKDKGFERVLDVAPAPPATASAALR